MTQVSLNALVAKLGPPARAALEQAAWLCRSMTHYDIELEHLFLKLSEENDTDFALILRHFNVDTSRLTRDLTAAADNLRRGNTRDTPGISHRIPQLLEAAWLHASVDLDCPAIRTGNLLYGLLSHPDLALTGRELSRELHRIDIDELQERYPDIVKGSREPAAPSGAAAAEPGTPGAAAAPGKGKALDLYTIDLTARAKKGEIDPVLGRDEEIRLMIDILMRRRQNNPILTGEPGVGKTAVVEGFAWRIAAGDVPEPLRNVAVRTLDLGLLQAGAGVRGEFENRLKGVIREVKESPVPIILFIDEAHTMIGAGATEGGSDAANLLKPALARGELRTIAATTWAEYKKYFEKDAALARRFQVIKVDEPDVRKATVMLRGLADRMEAHHRVRLLPDAIEAAVRLSDRYLSDRQLPDKAVSVLDTAAARVATGQGATPPLVEDARRRIENLKVERRILDREQATGADHSARLSELAKEMDAETGRLEELEARWSREKALVERIVAARRKLEPPAPGAKEMGKPLSQSERDTTITDLRDAEAQLTELQGELPLLHSCVDGQIVAGVISAWTGIPVGRMMADQVRTILNLKSLLAERIVGQDHALSAIAQRIQTSRANLGDPGQPIGVFLLVGPSGVGKTETGLALADLLYGGERNMITINMSEFQEPHTVSGLKGAPPGYVGYGEGGVLTEAVRRRPYSVILLDEAEKAHPDVMELFYQVFDKGMLEDGQGRFVSFKNTVILLTSNLATDKIVKVCADEETTPDAATLAKSIHADIVQHFKPALVGRLTVVPYYPLRTTVMRRILQLKVDKIRRRLEQHYGVGIQLTEAAAEAVLSRCTEPDTGARNVDHILTGTVLPELSRRILSGILEARALGAMEVDVGGDGDFVYREQEAG